MLPEEEVGRADSQRGGLSRRLREANVDPSFGAASHRAARCVMAIERIGEVVLAATS